MPIDYSPLFQQAPQSGLTRGLTHLSSVLDAIMERKSREEQQKALLAQQARLAAIDDARLQQQADQTAAHWEAENERLKAKDEQDSQDKAAARAEKAIPQIQSALTGEEPDLPGAQMWASVGGLKVGEAPQPIPQNAVSDLLKPPAPAAAPPGPDATSMPGPFNLFNPLGAAQLARQRAEQAQQSYEADPLGSPAQPPQQQPQGPRSFRVEGPGLAAPIDINPLAARQRALAQGQRISREVAGLGGNDEFGQRAEADVQRALARGAIKPGEEGKYFFEQMDKYKSAADAETRARIAAAAQRDKLDLSHPPGERDVQNRAGTKTFKALTKEDAEATKKKRAALLPIDQKLDEIDKLVGSMGWKERLDPLDLTEKQQAMSAAVETIIAPTTQLLGSGTPQDPEFKRRLNSLSVSWKQGPEVARKNIKAFREYVNNTYEQQLGTVVPGYQPDAGEAAKPSAKDLAARMRGGQ